jgi:hypothetical protein
VQEYCSTQKSAPLQQQQSKIKYDGHRELHRPSSSEAQGGVREKGNGVGSRRISAEAPNPVLRQQWSAESEGLRQDVLASTHTIMLQKSVHFVLMEQGYNFKFSGCRRRPGLRTTSGLTADSVSEL